MKNSLRGKGTAIKMKRLTALALTLPFLSGSVSAAIGTEAENAVEEQTASLSEQIAGAEIFLEETLAEDQKLRNALTDYHVRLERLRPLLREFQREKSAAEALRQMLKTGECTPEALAEAEKRRDNVKYKLESLLIDIKSRKSSIEETTGGTLPAENAPNAEYLITDAMKIDSTIALKCGEPRAICSSEPTRSSASDSGDLLNDAAQSYRLLGEAIRAYISARSELKKTNEKIEYGEISESAREAAVLAKENAYLAVAEEKANYSKILTELNRRSGGQLFGLSEATREKLKSTLPGIGKGLWTTHACGGQIVLLIHEMPVPYHESTDRIRLTVSYGGTVIGSADRGDYCLIEPQQFTAKELDAQVAIYRNGTLAAEYHINPVFPIGEFKAASVF